jgi:uncharacterized protein (DUF2236 family)
MAQPAPHLVSAGDLEKLLANLRQSSPDPSRGIFGPASISWKINRESALFLAATRAALLQLAHPWVAAAIAQHSKTFHDPIARFHQTFRVMFTMSFGSVDQAFAAARQLHRRHQTIRGTLPENAGRFPAATSYEANTVDALLWVYATLIDSSLLAYELVLPSLTQAERERYYNESRQAASLFGIPSECLPPDWAGFQTYINSTLQSDRIAVTSATRQMAHRLQDGAGLAIKPPFWYRSLTSELLPSRLRNEFQFSFGEREQRSAHRAVGWIRRIYPHLPAAIRFVGPYSEALCRREGHSPGLAIRLSNKLWIGKTSLFQPPSDSSASLADSSHQRPVSVAHDMSG